MKPFPKREEYSGTFDDLEGRDIISYPYFDGAGYDKARADWYESEVVPLLREAVAILDGVNLRQASSLASRINAVLAELERKT